jgi:hypothetical protein
MEHIVLAMLHMQFIHQEQKLGQFQEEIQTVNHFHIPNLRPVAKTFVMLGLHGIYCLATIDMNEEEDFVNTKTVVEG